MNPKIKAALRDPYYACNLLLNRIGRFVSDEQFVKWSYYLTFHRKLDLKNPKTFNEKLQWLKLYDRHEEYTQMVDKYEAKEYVASIIGEEYIIPTLGVYNSFDEIDFDKLPDQFVLKCTHDSGGVAICKDKATFDIKSARKLLSRNLKRNKYSTSREYPYQNVKPRIIAEAYMEDESGYELKDYKFFCFNGVPQFIQLDFDRFCNHKRNIYSLEWEPLNFTIKFPSDYNRLFEKPDRLNNMLEIAATLSSGIPHVRVDLYYIQGRIYFGELTFFHGSGLETFVPKEWDYKLGEYIHLPMK